MMTNRKRRRMRTLLLQTLAIGTTITWGSFGGVAAGDQPLALTPSHVNPTFLPVQATSELTDDADSSGFESSRRPAAQRKTPQRFDPPTAASPSKSTAPAATSAPSATSPPMGTWIPRGTRSLRTSTANSFTPWTTPDLGRRSSTAESETISGSKNASESAATSQSPAPVLGNAPGGQTPPSLRRDTHVESKTNAFEKQPMAAAESEQIRLSPAVDDPAPAPLPGTLRDQRRSAASSSMTLSESSESQTTDTSRRTRTSTREISRHETEQRSTSSRSTNSSSSEGAREITKREVKKLMPVQSPDSNEPIVDVVEPTELEPVPQEEQTDGDIDAESLERLRAAIRSFPGRSAARQERESDEEATSPSDRTARAPDRDVESRDKTPATEKRRTLTRDVQTLQPFVARVLTDYHRRPENVSKRSPWGTFHMMLPFGADANVQSGRNLHNSIAWLCSNRPLRGQRLITTTKSGRIYIRQGPGLQGHQAQLLAMLAQVNVEATYPLTDGRSRFTIEDLIRAEMADCRRGQELTFSLIGLSHYLPTDTQWRASDGTVWTFETLLAEELAQPIVGAACGGTHRLMGLSYALRQRRLEGLPIEGQWARADAFIKDFVDYAWSLQNRDGSFSTNWFEGPQDNRDLDRKVQTTGHIIEWLIFTADQDELQDPRFVRSIQFLTNAFTRYRTREWQPGPKGHVLRALSVYHRRVYGDARPWAQPSQVAQPGGRAYR